MLLSDATRGGVPASGAADSTGGPVCPRWHRSAAVHGPDAGMRGKACMGLEERL